MKILEEELKHMTKIFKKEQGITLITLIVTVMLLIIITGTLANQSYTSLQVSNLTKLQNDIQALDDRVATYWVKTRRVAYT